MVMNLQMLPMTVTEVADTASRSFQLKKFMASPTTHPAPRIHSPPGVTCAPPPPLLPRPRLRPLPASEPATCSRADVSAEAL